MKTLNLYRIWEILNLINEQEELINERDIYPCLLGNSSSYHKMIFESFLEIYSFKVEGDKICIFNDDPIPYEDYTNGDFSYIPTKFLELDDKRIKQWIDNEVKNYLKQETINKENEKKNLKQQIEMLTQRLERL